MRSEIRKFISYLLGKRSEIQDLDVNDIMLAKVILDIHRKRIAKEFVLVPLFSVKLIHPLDRENSMQVTERRAMIISEHRKELIATGIIDRAALAELRSEEQEVFLLRQNGDLTYEEIGKMLELPTGTVKTRMRLALTKLREAVAEF